MAPTTIQTTRPLPRPFRCCWATATGPSRRRRPSMRVAALTPWPLATSTAMASSIWRSRTWVPVVYEPVLFRCCWATATGPSRRHGPSPPARPFGLSPWATSMATASSIWRSPMEGRTPSRSCWAMAMGPSSPHGASLLVPAPCPSPWAISMAIGSKIWRWSTTLTSPFQCCSATATGPSGQEGRLPPATIPGRWPWPTSMAMARLIW